MPKLVTWNIQSARTRNGGADLGHVTATLDRFTGFDVLCLQEVACGFHARDGTRLPDGFAGLAARLPGYSASRATPLDTLAPDGVRCRFGTIVLSRYPVLQVLRHSLPWPADPGVTSMPRAALEVTLDTPGGLLRVVSVHLEYFSSSSAPPRSTACASCTAKPSCTRAHHGPGRRKRPPATRSRPSRAPRLPS